MKFACCKRIRNWFRCRCRMVCCETDMDCENDSYLDKGEKGEDFVEIKKNILKHSASLSSLNE